MIHPDCSEVLATIQTGFERDIVPHLHDLDARSAAATISHLLRHVALRVADEGQILTDDIARLRVLLSQIADWFDSSNLPDGAPLRGAFAETLPDGVYPSLTVLGNHVLCLRSALVTAQLALQGVRNQYAEQAAYQELRAAIRTYIAAQLEDESRLIVPAFLGQGPRR